MRAALAAVLIAISLTIALPRAAAQTADVAVVVNDKNPIDNLSSADLRKIFSGERHSWPGGLLIKLFVRAPSSHERDVLLKLLDMTESEYKQYWTAQVFRGEAQSEPIALFSNGMQKEALLVYPGAVALVSSLDVKAGMKVLRVNSHKPGETGYSFK
jgi:ABC-type phosphate transport system substrate-binding protein